MNQSKEMVKIAYDALDEKKANNIKVIRVDEITVIADYLLIAHGTSSSQITALVDYVDEKLSRAGYEKKRIEGGRNASWTLLDYGDLIVHIFTEEDRLFYDLERIWQDGTSVSREELN